MKTSAGRFVLTPWAVTAMVFLAQACARQGEPFVPIRPGVPESTKVEGYEDGTWTRQKSPYYVMKSVVVARNHTLRIEPGVAVVFTRGNLRVEGRLIAVGSPARSESLITFRPSKPTIGSASPGDWGGLVFLSHDNELKHARIQYAMNGVELIDGSLSIDNLYVTHSQLDAIVATRSDLTIRNSTIASNGAYGVHLISCEDPIYSVAIEHCNIGNNGFGGLWSVSSSALVTRSDIKNNGGSCFGMTPEEEVVCAGAHFEGTSGIKLPVFRMCNLESNTPCDIRNIMVEDLVVSADSAYWGPNTTYLMDRASPDRGNCDFNVKKICDALDSGIGGATVRFCWWRDQAWPNFSSSASSLISWSPPSARWRS